ncbi:MAG TPA: hypothetical protein VGJ19_07820 [Streptosporangiaceae bacterium]
MPVLMLVATVVILAGVVVVASGRGGEMAATEPDYPPIDLGPVTSADVALLRPPSAAWGYNMRVTDDALEVIAKAVTERDVHIAALQQEVSDLRDQLGGGGRPATPDRPGGDPPGGDRPGGGPAEGPADGPGEPEIPEPDWPGEAEDTTAAAPAAPITRPQPIYHADEQGEAADQASAPWGPATAPGEAPLGEPPPQATDVDQGGSGAPDGETSLPVTPATGWPAQEQDQPQPQAQDRARSGRRGDDHEFHWDEDPHQQIVWGSDHARAKAARATEETLPNSEHHDGDRD